MENKKKVKPVKRRGKFWVYILECADGSYYTGYTPDIKKRVRLHSEGKGARYTRSRLPVKLVWSKEFRCRHQVMSMEYRIKQLTKLQKASLIKGRRLDRVLRDA